MMEAVVNGAAALDGQQRMYSTHLKKVLKTYQLTAQRSLKGPAGVSAAAAASASKEEASKDGASGLPSAKDSSPPPQPPSAAPTVPPPVFYTQDRPKNSELLVTELRTARISCFNVGGELRLCLPQVFNLVLNGFQPTDIYAQCDELHIHCSRCNQEQLDVLKCTKKLPDTAVSCGLITQTDAERLCGALLNNKARGAPPGKMLAAKSMAVRVYHECFGKCFGLLTPSFFYGDSSMCVECETCNYLFSPQNFVTHVHRRPENRTCHWGFNSSNWRAYLLLDEDQENADQYQEVLKELKQRRVDKFDKPHKRKQVCSPPIYSSCGSKGSPPATPNAEYDESIKSESPPLHTPGMLTNGKRQRFHYEVAGFPPSETHVFGTGPPPYSFHDPYHGYTWFQPWMTVPAAYRNWPIPTSKETLKGLQVREPLAYSFLSHAPPVLMNPSRVVPFSESDRFESQPNVALAPLAQSIQKALTHVKKEASASLGKEPKQEVVQRPSSTTAPGHTYNPEIELSTDTDTEDSNSANGVEDETQELLGSLARCVGAAAGDTRQQGEAALQHLGANLIASREAQKVLAGEVQLLKEKLDELECRLSEERAQHEKEIAAMSLERLRTPHVIQNPLNLQNGSPQRTSPATSVITSSSTVVKKEPVNVD